MNIKIAVCDDEQDQTKYLTRLCREWAEKEGITVEILPFPSAESYLFYNCEDKSTDILLLDIEMPGMSGMELAQKLRYDKDNVQIVFITGYSDFIAEGYDVSALHYLIKPINEKKFYQVLSQAVALISKKKTSILFSSEGTVLRLFEEDIYYFEASGHGTIAYTSKGHMSVSESISCIANKLSGAFIQCHRSYIVNLSKISYISKTIVNLDDNIQIPLARGKYSFVNQSFLGFHMKRSGDGCGLF